MTALQAEGIARASQIMMTATNATTDRVHLVLADHRLLSDLMTFAMV